MWVPTDPSTTGPQGPAPQPPDVLVQDGITFDARKLRMLRRAARIALDAHVLPEAWRKDAQEMSALF